MTNKSGGSSEQEDRGVRLRRRNASYLHKDRFQMTIRRPKSVYLLIENISLFQISEPRLYATTAREKERERE